MERLWGNENTETRVLWTEGNEEVKRGCYVFTNIGPVGPVKNISTVAEAERIANDYNLILIDK